MLGLNMNSNLCDYVPDITDTKIYRSKQITLIKTRKHICFVKSENKYLDAIRLSKIFNHSDIIKHCPIIY